MAPFTEEQRRLFHAMAEDDEVAEQHGTSQKEARKLAREADDLAREGKEKPAKKAAVMGFIDLSGVFVPGRGKTE